MPSIDLVALSANESEAARLLEICNACRYCEGFCAVFPAMTRRLTFQEADVHYLANLCHNCGACLHACQYAPPHEFHVNVPRAMAKVRADTYTAFAWPRALGALYRRSGLTLSVALSTSLALFLMLAVVTKAPLWRSVGPDFYAIFPHNLMVGLFAPVFLFAVVALAIGVRKFWRQEVAGPVSLASIGEASHSALTLRYLGGGHGDGCNEEDDAFSNVRRMFHHLTFYGFLLCFAATSVAFVFHYFLRWPAPYPVFSAPKVLGIAGGIGLVVGTMGLFALNVRRHPLPQDTGQRTMDRGFMALLFLTAASGLGLMWLKGTAALPVALCVHLGAVMALFLTLPYGKFAHAVYRSAALLKWAIERRQPGNVHLNNE